MLKMFLDQSELRALPPPYFIAKTAHFPFWETLLIYSMLFSRTTKA